MRGYRFYLEHDSPTEKRKGKHRGTVFALSVKSPLRYDKHADGKWCQEGAGSVFNTPNSPVCWCETSIKRLRDVCKKISEAEARKIHPALFQHLES
jgi:hypothetical protein